jgi:hypothetical protein
MALQIRRGTESDRTSNGSFNSFLPAQGELVYTTDNKELFVGDGSTYGGIRVAPVRGISTVGRGVQTGTVSLTSDDIAQGSTNTYYSTNQAKTDAAAALVAGNGGNTGITFSFNSGTKVITATVTNVGSLTSVQSDANPSLGGNLGLNSHNITGTGNINIAGTVTTTGITMNNTTIDGNTFTFSGSNNLLSFVHGAIKISTDTTDNNKGLYIYGSSTSSTNTSSSINVFSSRGTVATPTIAINGDIINAFGLNTYNGTAYQASGGMFFTVDGTISNGGQIPSKFSLTVGDGTNALGTVAMSFNKLGSLYAPIIQTGLYATGSYPATPSKGMIIFDSTLNHFYGYNGTAWVAFTGP